MAHTRTKSASRSTLANGFRFSDRYRLERMLGRGASATVYSAVDEHTDALVALKHLLAEADFSQRALFQREYYTLAQITHPGVIRAFDYGTTDDGPFYTMELLDGADLSELAPLPWPDACRVLREVASALAILHSRRLIHRDVSHRNVRLTADGHAKLIDFGAMAPMGFVPDLIGTPPFLSPDAVDGELLDQRADLYALGALGHWLLAARHLYPAKTVRALREMWRAPPKPAFPDDIPAALQQLLMALVQRDPRARPNGAAEVIDRLTAIAGLPAGDDAAIARSYLQNPPLIGRQSELSALKLALERAAAGNQGPLLLIAGASGSGKSRLLQELVIQSKFLGFTVLNASAQAGDQRPFGVAAQLAAELLHKRPALAASLSEARALGLSRVLPQLVKPGATVPAEPREQAREQNARLQTELVALLLEGAASEHLLFAVDDLHACDDDSLSVLLELTLDDRPHPALVATLRHPDTRRPKGARALAERAVRSVELHALTELETESLVASLFSGSPHGARVAAWMHEHGRGNPLECMELARHLVERRAAHYVDGVWMLADELPSEVPHGLSDALKARVAALEPDARSLAEVLALYGKPASLPLCIELFGAQQQGALFGALSQLVSAELLQVRGDQYAIGREALRSVLVEGLSPSALTALHQRVGEVLCAGDAHATERATLLEAGHHLMRGRDHVRGIELIEQAVPREDALSALGAAVVPALELALQRLLTDASEHATPARIARLRARLTTCAFLYDKRLVSHAEPLLLQLRADSGLDAFDGVGTGTALERLGAALTLAQARHDALPSAERGVPPLQALLEFGAAVGSALAVAIFGFDAPKIRQLAELVAPYGCFGPELGFRVMYDLVTLVDDSMAGRQARAQEARLQLLAQLRDPAMYAGLPEAQRRTIQATQLHALGMRTATQHSRRAREIADEILALDMQMHLGVALQVRLLTELYRGDADAARALELQLDSVSLQPGPGRQTEIWLLGYLVGPYALWGDVIALKRTAERLAALLPDNPGYRSTFYSALGAYYRERGQLAASKTALSHALQVPERRPFSQWAAAMAQYIETLVSNGELETALALAAEHFGPIQPDDGTQREISYRALLPVVSLARARLGEIEAAEQQLDVAIAAAEADDRPLVYLGRLWEARARVAMLAHDPQGFERCAERMGALYRSVNNSVLLLKHLALLDDGARAGFAKLEPRSAEAHEERSMPTVQERRISTLHELSQCGSDAERWQRSLQLLLGSTSAVAGVLLVGSPELRIVAKSAGEAIPQALLDAARGLSSSETRSESVRSEPDVVWVSPGGEPHLVLPLTAAIGATFGAASAAGDQGVALLGVAALRFTSGTTPQRPNAGLLSAIGRALHEAAELSIAKPFEDWLVV